MDGFQIRKERKKESIMQAALELFSTYGTKKVSVAEIAAKAQASQVSIYNHFGSKENLVKEVLLRFLENSYKEVENLMRSPLSFPQKIEHFFIKKMELEQQGQGLINYTLLNEPQILKFLEEYAQNRAIPMFIELFEQGKEEGFVDRDIPNESLIFYINMSREVSNQPHFFSEKNRPVRLGLLKLFLYGLMGKPPKQQ